MKVATLVRGPSTDEGTFGVLTTDSGFSCRTGELPWRDNRKGISCIPEGTYEVKWRPSPSHGMCYHVERVEGRTDVEIHAANFMGDQSTGYYSQLRGCIAPGLTVDTMANADGRHQKAVTHSKDALKALISDLNQETFLLTITNKSQE